MYFISNDRIFLCIFLDINIFNTKNLNRLIKGQLETEQNLNNPIEK